MTFSRTRFLLFISALAFFSCRKPSNANWDVDLVLPVVTADLNIQNFSGDSLFQTGTGGLLHLKIKREVASLLLDSLFSIPDTAISSSFTNSFVPVGRNPGEGLPIAPKDLEFKPGHGILLKRAVIRSGSILVKFSNKLPQPIDLVYLLPTVKKDGQVFTIKETVPTGTNSLVKTYDIAGYDMGLRGISGTNYNTLAQNFTVNISTTASGSVLVPTGEVASLEVNFNGAKPEFVEGYFGQDTITIDPDTTDISIINNLKASNFMLSEATMDFSIVNELGTEFSGSLANISAINTQSHKTVVLTNNGLSSINLNRATRNGSVVTPTTKNLLFNNTNSNITSFISNLPDKISYQGQVVMNPLGNISGSNDFAFANTGIRILADIDIPLRFTADYLELTTVDDVKFESSDQLDHVNSGRFVIQATNGFPFTAKVQAYMYNDKKQLIDSIFVGGANYLIGGDVNAQNEVTTPRYSKIYIPVTKLKIDNLTKCKTIEIVSRLIMPPNPPEIKLLENYKLDIKVTAELSYNIGL